MPYDDAPVYCDDSDLDARFGKDIVDQYARIDKSTEDADVLERRLWARYQASRDVDDALRGGHYEVPFTVDDPTVRDITAYLALVRLYELKGTMDWSPDSGKPQHRYHFQRKDAQDKLRRIRSGTLRLRTATTYKTALGVRNDKVATGAVEGRDADSGNVTPGSGVGYPLQEETRFG
jgi:phage gp36-like protein